MNGVIGHTKSTSPWVRTLDELPPINREVVCWCEGFKEHSGASFRRAGKAFMARWDGPDVTMAHGWGRRFYDEALKKLDADSLYVTHWVLLEEPEARSDDQETVTKP